MRFNMRIAISALVGALLLAILGVGIWRMVEADDRGERHGARYETIGPNDKAAITTDQAIAAALAAHRLLAGQHPPSAAEDGNGRRAMLPWCAPRLCSP